MSLLVFCLFAALLWTLLPAAASDDDVDLWTYRKSGKAFRANGSWWFALNGTRHAYPNRFTHIAYSFWETEAATAEQEALPVGLPIRSRWVSNAPNTIILGAQKDFPDKTNVMAENMPALGGVMNAGLMYRGPPFNDWIARIAKASLHDMKTPGGHGRGFVGENDFRLAQIPARGSSLGGSGSGSDSGNSFANSSTLTEGLAPAVQWLQSNIERFSGDAPAVPVVDLGGADPRMLQTHADSDVVYYCIARHSRRTHTKLYAYVTHAAAYYLVHDISVLSLMIVIGSLILPFSSHSCLVSNSLPPPLSTTHHILPTPTPTPIPTHTHSQLPWTSEYPSYERGRHLPTAKAASKSRAGNSARHFTNAGRRTQGPEELGSFLLQRRVVFREPYLAVQRR